MVARRSLQCYTASARKVEKNWGKSPNVEQSEFEHKVWMWYDKYFTYVLCVVMIFRGSRSIAETEFVESSLAKLEDGFPPTDKMPLRELPPTDFQDSVIAEDIDFDTIPAELQDDFRNTGYGVIQPEAEKPAPLVEPTFFKDAYNPLDPFAEMRRGTSVEEINMDEESFSRFFE